MNSDNKMKILAVLISIAVIMVSVLIINTGGDDARTDYPASVTDYLGREVTFEEVPERIISVAPAVTEMVYTLGLGDKVVGVTDYCDWPEQVVIGKNDGTITSIGEYWEPSLETIINLNPDLVVLSGGVSSHMQIADQLDSMGIEAFVTWRGENLTEIYQNIEVLGEICDCQESSSALIQSLQNRVENVGNVISGHTIKKALHVVWLDPVFTCGGKTFISQIISLAGGDNIFSDLSGWPIVSLEEIIDQQPDVITFIANPMMTPEELIQSLESDPLWSQVPAVNNGEVYVLEDQGEDIFSRQSVRIVDGLEIMAEILHPKAFGVTMPHVIGDDYQDYLISETSGNVDTVTMQGNMAYV